MSSAASVRGTAATASSSARAESAATRVLARGDSTASHASVPSLLRQTFFDEVQHRDYRRCGSSASVALSDRSRQPAAAAAVPPPPPLSSVAHHPLRRLARHLDTDFFAEAATAEDAARDSANAVTRVAARSCSDSSSSTTSSNGSRHITVDPSPPPAVAVAVAAVRHIGEESAFNPTTSTAAPRQHHVRSATAAAALPFAERYAASDNPYLRAAAVELTGVHVADTSGGEAPWAAEMIGATRVAPRLARPVAEALTAAPSSSPPIRGIPLFTATHRPARWAAATSDGGGAAVVSAAAAAAAAAPMESLRQSWEDYGRVQLQDEALGWLHRCRVLEQELARLQDAHHRQSRLLAAHWPRHDADVDDVPPPQRSAAAFTSRSPDSPSRAYVCAETPPMGDAAATSSCTSPAGQRATHDRPTLSQPTAGIMPHRHPAGDVTGSAAHGVRAGVCRGLGEAKAAVEAASSPSASPTPRVPVGLPTNREPQTPRTAADEVVVVMEPAAAAAAAAPPATAPVPGPSAILSRQYAAVVAEVELLRARADVAEREAVELRELRDAQELRCDDLETQLLAREEQLLRATQQTPSPSPAALSLDQHITAAQELLVVLGQSHCGGGSDDDAAAVVSSTPLVSSPPVDDGERLAALLLQARSTAAAAAQQHAALVAELEVVRADRNELIGVQGNQVRALQEQLLDRDTAQCHLLEQLHRAQEQLAAAATVSGKTPAVDAATASSLPASRGAETALPGADAPSAPLKDTGAAAVEEVLALREQLEQMRTSAAVRLETQRQLLTERLALAASELKEARLRAEDDYDRLSGTIETLTRELADTKEALRIKEVSLRIALRESLVPPPLRITGEHAGTAAVTSVGNVLAVTSAAERQLHRVDPNTSAAGRSSSPSAPAHSDGIARTSASPSPPMPPHLASPSAAITTVATAASTATSRGGGWMSWLADPAKHGHARVKEDVGEDRGAGSTEACVSHRSTTASHERSSRGLTVSTGGAAAAASESATSPPPPPREGSGSSSGGVAVAVQRASSLPSTATAAAPVSPPLAQPPPPRRSASARLADLISEGELPLPLPLPLRSPLFSTAAAADSPAATSPESPRSPPMSRRAGVRGGRLGVVASCEGVGVGASLDASAKAGSSCGSLTPQEKLCELLSDVWAGAPSAVAAAVDSAERGRGGVLPKGEAGVDVLLLPPASGTTHARSRAASHSADAATTAPVDVTATTPARTPLSLLSASASSRSAGFTPAAAARLSPSSTPTSSYSPHAAAVAARHVQAALHRHRATWQQQEQILSSLRSSPSS